VEAKPRPAKASRSVYGGAALSSMDSDNAAFGLALLHACFVNDRQPLGPLTERNTPKHFDSRGENKEPNTILRCQSLGKKATCDMALTLPARTWVLLECLRMRAERLPGGLMPLRAEILSTVKELQENLRNLDDQDIESPLSLPSVLQPATIDELSGKVENLEASYLHWAQDPEALPTDAASKKFTLDWLDEKPMVMEQIESLGARRCVGPGHKGGRGCQKFLRYDLYKADVKRCSACLGPSKRATARMTNKRMQQQQVENRNSQGTGHARKGRIAKDESSKAKTAVKEVSFDISTEADSLVTGSYMEGEPEHLQVAA